jgi:hypothetical protein
MFEVKLNSRQGTRGVMSERNVKRGIFVQRAYVLSTYIGRSTISRTAWG